MSGKCTPPMPPPPPPIESCQPSLNIKKEVARNLRNVQNAKSTELSAHEEATQLGSRVIDANMKNGDNHLHFISVHWKVPAIVQDGPQCGLVALCMAANTIKSGFTPDLQIVFQQALDAGFTKAGEMFSATNMCSLGKHIYGCQGEVVIETEDPSGLMVDALLQHKAVLVPYDRDANNEPCEKNGTKAHWVLLTGVMMATKDEILNALIEKYSLDPATPVLTHIKDKVVEKTLGIQMLKCALDDPGSVYVYANQGKSLHTQLWSLSKLLASNSQLTTLDPDIAKKPEDYILPGDNSVAAGLCGQFVVFW